MAESRKIYEVVLWVDYIDPQKLVADRVMLCTNNIIMLNKASLDIFNAILQSSSAGGIIKP